MSYGYIKSNTTNTPNMCFCTGACKEPGGRCAASTHIWPEPTTAPWPNPFPDTTPWPNPIVPDVPMPTPRGWVCPVCGRGNAPDTQTCPCIPIPMVWS